MIILKNKNYPFNPCSFLKYNENKIYRERNKLTNSIFSLDTATGGEKYGQVAISVFTASGALPVPDALITIYQFDENGQEIEITYSVTDASGQIPPITLPVTYYPAITHENEDFLYATYNLRVQAINYYTVNIIDFRIFPDVTTYLTVDMIPAPAEPNGVPERTIVIPPSPVDMSDD